MLQYLTPDVTMALLKVQQGTEVHIAGEYLMESMGVPNRGLTKRN
jgi:hypothetical protein